MTLPEGLLFLLFAAISLLSAAVAMILTGFAQNAFGNSHRVRNFALDADAEDTNPSPPVTTPIRYVFAEGRLVSRVGSNDPFLPPDIERGFAPTALSEAMATLRPDLPDRIADLIRRGEPFRVIGYLGTDALSVTGAVEQETLVVSVAPAVEGEGRLLEETERYVQNLQRGAALSADAQWIETPGGLVTWCNPTYLTLCAQTHDTTGDIPSWPLRRVFADQLDPLPTDGSQRRCHLKGRDADVTHWFEVATTHLSGDEILCNARPIDKLVAAETSLRDFVQTLSKTFATLPVGLAVFDKKRELVLFNPALVSTSLLDPVFLSRRPSLRIFLDQLREMRRMPEPRDYGSWRDEMAVLEQSAEQDRYHEIWTLPSGETLRVTGRPHPNGAIAFLFEDISQEVSLTRRFRTDLDLDRGILDDLPAALIVFDRDGDVRRTNAAYRAMLTDRLDGDHPGLDATLMEMTCAWQAMFEPSGLWGEIRQFARHETDRAAWSDIVTDLSGACLHCRVAPLKGGNTIVWFLPEEASWRDLLTDDAWPVAVHSLHGGDADSAQSKRGEDVA